MGGGAAHLRLRGHQVQAGRRLRVHEAFEEAGAGLHPDAEAATRSLRTGRTGTLHG
ncbi:hypothetical protein [Kocuria sabuli]|uniref:hypothetical protein n=1 Tax=Kocuria sabuli TaxID=3071448 RepID=UPI0034D6F773